MAPRQMKMPEKTEAEPEEHFSQRKRPELGRYLLQVDGQTKGSYQTAESAESAGLAIKKEYPILHVTVYDSVDFASTVLGSSARQSERTFERAQAATLISDRALRATRDGFSDAPAWRPFEISSPRPFRDDKRAAQSAEQISSKIAGPEFI